MTKRFHHKHVTLAYPVSIGQRLYSIVLGPLIMILAMIVVLHFFSQQVGVENFSLNTLFAATGATLGRLVVAYMLALVISIPLALIALQSPVAEKIFLPVFDIFESVPVLVFFPILIIIFVRYDFLNGAAIFILFLSMLWNLVFTLVGGLKVIPRDIFDAAHVFGLRGFQELWKVTLPAIVPELVTGSILAFAQGWNITIVAEVLHVYIPNSSSSQDLFGIGSILVNAAARGQGMLFIWAIVMMVAVIAIMNFFVWQKLLHYAERYKFE